MLYIVPTPVGNLEDITFRAINTLKMVDVIFSEDTRVTLQLLNHFEIKNKLIALHDHNEDIVKDKVLEYLRDGKNVAIVTDRGTPIISDPGYKTVKFLKEKGYNPINQIVGYILSEDPTYITTHNNARSLIRRVDRDTLLQNLVKYYLSH